MVFSPSEELPLIPARPSSASGLFITCVASLGSPRVGAPLLRFADQDDVAALLATNLDPLRANLVVADHVLRAALSQTKRIVALEPLKTSWRKLPKS